MSLNHKVGTTVYKRNLSLTFLLIMNCYCFFIGWSHCTSTSPTSTTTLRSNASTTTTTTAAAAAATTFPSSYSWRHQHYAFLEPTVGAKQHDVSR
jgi:hypothetical protein